MSDDRNRNFPLGSPASRRRERWLRRRTSRLSEGFRLRVYALAARLEHDMTPFSFRLEDRHVVIGQNSRSIWFPRPLQPHRPLQIGFGYLKWLEEKYRLPGFVEIVAGDVVVDCGGYVGGLSLAAAGRAGEVHVFEPAPDNLDCIRANLKGLPNVKINAMGLYDVDTVVKLNLSTASSEHSLLAPDAGEAAGVLEVPVVRLDSYCARNGVRRVDFLKIEAEGVEVEVLRGAQALRPARLAIDVSPERNGESPADEIASILSEDGYAVRRRGDVLFARRPDCMTFFAAVARGRAARRTAQGPGAAITEEGIVAHRIATFGRYAAAPNHRKAAA